MRGAEVVKQRLLVVAVVDVQLNKAGADSDDDGGGGEIAVSLARSEVDKLVAAWSTGRSPSSSLQFTVDVVQIPGRTRRKHSLHVVSMATGRRAERRIIETQ